MKNAFTLAEVLITLGIIGIVAAMTLPAVINNARNKQLETGLKRSYSLISQALDMYQSETGERITAENLKNHELKPILMKYLHTVEDCGWGARSASESCIPNINHSSYDKDNNRTRGTYKTYNGSKNIDIQMFDDGQFVLNDGSLVLLENFSSGRLYISVDVNGYNKNPNRLGHDLFMFQIDKQGALLPMGAEGTTYNLKNGPFCSIASSNSLNGAGCTYNALTDKDFFKNLPK